MLYFIKATSSNMAALSEKKSDNSVVLNMGAIGSNLIGIADGSFLFPDPSIVSYTQNEYEFEKIYTDYLYNNKDIFIRLFQYIIDPLFADYNVYLIISPISDIYEIVYSSFQTVVLYRYGIQYAIINEPSDFDDIVEADSFDINGIEMYDYDHAIYIKYLIDSGILKIDTKKGN